MATEAAVHSEQAIDNRQEAGVRKDAMRGVVGVVAVLGLAACGGSVAEQPRGRIVTPSNNETVTIKLDCRNLNAIEVDVDKWVVDLANGGQLSFRYIPQGDAGPTATITSSKKTGGASWKFSPFPITVPTGQATSAGNASGTTGNRPTYYGINLTCGSGTNQRTVFIDPDIFVD